MTGFLPLATLRQLSQRPLAGYGLMQAIHQNTGWKPSPGSLYPVLARLVAEGSATVKSQGRKRIYTITRRGLAALQELEGRARDQFQRVASQLKVCSPGRADKDSQEILERLSKGEAPFGWLTRDLLEIRRLSFLVSTKELDAVRKRDIHDALRNLESALRRAS